MVGQHPAEPAAKRKIYRGRSPSENLYRKLHYEKTIKNNGELPKYLVKDHHEAIINHGLFERVQIEIARRAGKRRVSGKGGQMELSHYSGRYALTELLICGHCGSPYKRVTWTANGKKRIVWRCTSRLSYGKKYCADSPTIPEGALHAALLTALNTAMTDRKQMIAILDESLTSVMAEKNESSVSPTVVRNRIQLLEKSMAELLPIIGRSDNPEVFDEQMKAISDEIAALQASLDEQERQAGSDEFSHQLGDMRTALQNAPFEISEYSDNVVRQMIDTIRVMDGNRLLITFKGGYEVKQPIIE